jgi:hypothetical protein
VIEPGKPAGYLLEAVGELLFVKLQVFDIRDLRSVCRLPVDPGFPATGANIKPGGMDAGG